jgi:hypothetical protein
MGAFFVLVSYRLGELSLMFYTEILLLGFLTVVSILLIIVTFPFSIWGCIKMVQVPPSKHDNKNKIKQIWRNASTKSPNPPQRTYSSSKYVISFWGLCGYFGFPESRSSSPKNLTSPSDWYFCPLRERPNI